jgi:hypothetical protein
MSGTDILKLEGGTYMVDYDAKVEYGDRFIWLHKKTKEFYSVIYPSQVSSYIKVKVTWYYEDKGVDNTVVYEVPEEELTAMLTAELGAQIDRDIINMLRNQEFN